MIYITDIPKDYKRLAHITKPRRNHAILVISDDPLMYIETVLYDTKTKKILMWGTYETSRLFEIFEELEKQRYEILQRSLFH
jgi:hypothetical protein